MKTFSKALPSCLLTFAVFGLSGCPDPVNQLPGTEEVGTEDDDDTTEGEDDIGATGDTEEGNTMFIPDVDDDGGTGGPTCDPWAQDCPEGEKCVAYADDGGGVWNSNKCVPVMGDGAAGDDCTWNGILEATDSCDAGTVCWDVQDLDGELIGVCTPFCDGTVDDPICGPESECLIANEGTINLCIETCDPLLQACSDGLGCYWGGNNFQCIFQSGSNIPTGDPCGFINDCEPSNFCAAAEALPSCNGSACCAAFCDLSDPVCPIQGTECAPFFEEGQEIPGLEDVGLCIQPG